jgi:glycosyltransferase involved in cell wall biosynthesis
MTKIPDISVIMSVYNSENYIEDTIQSILNQDFTNFELLIIDDASTDNTFNLISKYNDERIKLFKNDKNLGYVINLNILMYQAKGRYIARHDADDISHKSRFDYQFKVMENNRKIDVCGTSAISFGNYNKLMYVYNNNDYIKSQMFFSNALIHPSIMIRRELLKKYNLCYNDTYKPTEDYSLWTSLSYNVIFYNISKPLLRYRLHSNNSSVINEDLINKINIIRHNYFKLNKLDFSLEDSSVISKFIFNLNLDLDIIKAYFNLYYKLPFICEGVNLKYIKNIYFLYIIKLIPKQKKYNKHIFIFILKNINISNLFFIASYFISNKIYSIFYNNKNISNFV